MLRITSPDLKMVRLVLAVGSRAGLAAPLQTGYYMIGRHNECQIRPKSRSVSRRHCLLHNEDGVLRLFDLDSAAGTFKNDRRMDPGKWHEVQDRDEVRFGKVRFVVELDDVDVHDDLQVIEKTRQQSERSDAHSDASILRGAAWQDVDVAGFLDSEDQADREIRYQNIRSAVSTTDDEAECGMESLAEPEEVQSKIDSGKGVSKESGKSTAVRSPLSRKKRLAKSVRRVSRGGGAAGQRDLLERGKVVGLTVLAATVLTFFCYSVYSFYAGPEAKVLQEID